MGRCLSRVCRATVVVLAGAAGAGKLGAQADAGPALPDSPGVVMYGGGAAQSLAVPQMPAPVPLCIQGPNGQKSAQPCIAPEDRVQPIISRPETGPLTRTEKGRLAWDDFIDPFNLVTIAGYSAISVGINPHSAYGPGVKGWAKLTGYGLAEDGQGEFLGTFALPVLFHQDPRYRRMPGKPIGRRVLHAIAHTVRGEHDDGRPMPNWSTLLVYPMSAELSNLYVPGVQTDSASTARRVAIGLATNPAGDIVAEFLPDVARHLHVRVIFLQEIINQVATGGSAPNVM